MTRKYEISSDGQTWYIMIIEIAGERIAVDIFNVTESNPVEALRCVIEYLDG